jgi:hypothetical protein
MPLGVWENSSQHGRNEWKRKKKERREGGGRSNHDERATTPLREEFTRNDSNQQSIG